MSRAEGGLTLTFACGREEITQYTLWVLSHIYKYIYTYIYISNIYGYFHTPECHRLFLTLVSMGPARPKKTSQAAAGRWNSVASPMFSQSWKDDNPNTPAEGAPHLRGAQDLPGGCHPSPANVHLPV